MIQFTQRKIVFFVFLYVTVVTACQQHKQRNVSKRVVSVQVKESENKNKEQSKKEFIEKIKEQYLKNLEAGDVFWGGIWELMAISNIRKIKITVEDEYNTKEEGLQPGFFSKDYALYKDEIKLQRVNNNHYNYYLKNKVIKVIGDGSCLFRSVLGALKKYSENDLQEEENVLLDNAIKELKKDIAGYWRKNKDSFSALDKEFEIQFDFSTDYPTCRKDIEIEVKSAYNKLKQPKSNIKISQETTQVTNIQKSSSNNLQDIIKTHFSTEMAFEKVLFLALETTQKNKLAAMQNQKNKLDMLLGRCNFNDDNQKKNLENIINIDYIKKISQDWAKEGLGGCDCKNLSKGKVCDYCKAKLKYFLSEVLKKVLQEKHRYGGLVNYFHNNNVAYSNKNNLYRLLFGKDDLMKIIDDSKNWLSIIEDIDSYIATNYDTDNIEKELNDLLRKTIFTEEAIKKKYNQKVQGINGSFYMSNRKKKIAHLFPIKDVFFTQRFISNNTPNGLKVSVLEHLPNMLGNLRKIKDNEGFGRYLYGYSLENKNQDQVNNLAIEIFCTKDRQGRVKCWSLDNRRLAQWIYLYQQIENDKELYDRFQGFRYYRNISVKFLSNEQAYQSGLELKCSTDSDGNFV